MPPRHRCKLRLQPPGKYEDHAERVETVVRKHLREHLVAFEVLYGMEPIAELTIEADHSIDETVWRRLVDAMREVADDVVEDVEDVRTLFEPRELDRLQPGGDQGA
jgi:hypothetical protein